MYILGLATLVLILMGIWFYKHQNKSENSLSGKISLPKYIWLNLYIYLWFIIPLAAIYFVSDTGLIIFYLIFSLYVFKKNSGNIHAVCE